MLPLISKLIRNKEFQDLAGVCRGVYRILDGINHPILIEE